MAVTDDACVPEAAHSIHYTNFNMTAPIVTKVARGVCEPRCEVVQQRVHSPSDRNSCSPLVPKSLTR
eukprot:6078631-Amphidinium_carterae.1